MVSDWSQAQVASCLMVSDWSQGPRVSWCLIGLRIKWPHVSRCLIGRSGPGEDAGGRDGDQPDKPCFDPGMEAAGDRPQAQRLPRLLHKQSQWRWGAGQKLIFF